MRPSPLATLVWALVVILGAARLSATPLDEGPRSRQHPVGLGMRLTARASDYAMAGAGGQLRIRLHDRVAVDLFADLLLGQEAGLLRHDHEIGGVLQYHLFRGREWSVGPLLGACTLLAVAHTEQDQTLYDVRFGARAGVGGEWRWGSRVTLQAQALAIAYVGQDFDVYRFTADTSDTVSVRPAAQVVVGANYWF